MSDDLWVRINNALAEGTGISLSAEELDEIIWQLSEAELSTVIQRGMIALLERQLTEPTIGTIN